MGAPWYRRLARGALPAAHCFGQPTTTSYRPPLARPTLCHSRLPPATPTGWWQWRQFLGAAAMAGQWQFDGGWQSGDAAADFAPTGRTIS
jgi:hypothetical protein